MGKLKLGAASMTVATLMACGVVVVARQAGDASGPGASTDRPPEVGSPRADPGTGAVDKPAPEGKAFVNRVEGETTILFIEPEGSRVTKGQLVCELDSATLKDTLINQMITTETAKAALADAQKALEFAEIARKEYVDAIAPIESDALRGAMELAQAEMTWAEERIEEAERDPRAAALKQARIDRLRAKIALGQAQSKLALLTEYTMPRRIRELERDIAKARATEGFQEAKLALEQAKAEKLKDQISLCRINSPADGVITYASAIEAGATVRERQILFRIVPEGSASPKP